MEHQDTRLTSMRPRLKELNDNPYFSNWLTNAGTSAQSRKLYLSSDFVRVNQGQLDNFKGSLIPETWELEIYWK